MADRVEKATLGLVCNIYANNYPDKSNNKVWIDQKEQLEANLPWLAEVLDVIEIKVRDGKRFGSVIHSVDSKGNTPPKNVVYLFNVNDQMESYVYSGETAELEAVSLYTLITAKT